MFFQPYLFSIFINLSFHNFYDLFDFRFLKRSSVIVASSDFGCLFRKWKTETSTGLSLRSIWPSVDHTRRPKWKTVIDYCGLSMYGVALLFEKKLLKVQGNVLENCSHFFLMHRAFFLSMWLVCLCPNHACYSFLPCYDFRFQMSVLISS